MYSLEAHCSIHPARGKPWELRRRGLDGATLCSTSGNEAKGPPVSADVVTVDDFDGGIQQDRPAGGADRTQRNGACLEFRRPAVIGRVVKDRPNANLFAQPLVIVFDILLPPLLADLLLDFHLRVAK